MNVRVYMVSGAAEGAALQAALADQGIDTSLAARSDSFYLAIWSDRTDVSDLVGDLAPRSTPVNLEHVPAARPNEHPLVR